MVSDIIEALLDLDVWSLSGSRCGGRARIWPRRNKNVESREQGPLVGGPVQRRV